MVRRLMLMAVACGLLCLASCGSSNPVVEIDTSMGKIKVELYKDKAPITVANFLKYVDEKHYDGTIFHRVISNFMIQGGGFTPDMKEKPTHPAIKNEAGNGLSNDRGTIAMARTDEPDSATDQFFINVADNQDLNRNDNPNPFLKNAGYAVFGKVIEGMDVVDKIRHVEVKTIKKKVQHPDGKEVEVPLFENVPVEPVIIKSIRRVEKK